MRTIYLLQHNPGITYSDKKILRAYERKEDAEALIDLVAAFIRGDLQIVELSLEGAPVAPPAAPPVAPSFPPYFPNAVPGVFAAGNPLGDKAL